MLGMHGNYGANINQNHSDLIIAIGMRFDDRVTGNLEKYIKQAKVIHIEIDKSEINKTYMQTWPSMQMPNRPLNNYYPWSIKRLTRMDENVCRFHG